MEPESYIRNIVLGRRLLRKFAPGVNLEVMTHNDVMPGPSQMPQILTKGGANSAAAPNLDPTWQGAGRYLGAGETRASL
jgi:hypothetical protein